MNENHHIDDLFRESINKHGISPSDKVWASIDKKLQAKAMPAKKTKLGKPYLVGAVTILGSLALLTTYYVLPKDNKANTTVKSTKQESVKPAEEQLNITSYTAADNSNKNVSSHTVKSNSNVVAKNNNVAGENSSAQNCRRS